MGALDLSGVSGAQDSTLRTVNTSIGTLNTTTAALKTYLQTLETTDTQLLASASRTITQTSADLTNLGRRSLSVVLDMTIVGTGSVTVSIDMKDTTSGKWINLLTGAAIITNTVNRYRVSPDLAAAANSIAQDLLPRTFRIVVTANNANAATYSVGYHLHG